MASHAAPYNGEVYSRMGRGRALSRFDSGLHNERKLQFEQKLLDELEEMDDPLELFIDYINWLLSLNSGEGGNDQLQSLLERCLLYIMNIDTYYNDPRFLKVWLHYINAYVVQHDLEECERHFVFMWRRHIGSKLALFYEEFAQLLFQLGKVDECYLILRVGLERNARPSKRLKKNTEKLKEKLQNAAPQLKELEPLATVQHLFNHTMEPKFLKNGSCSASFKTIDKLPIFKDAEDDEPHMLRVNTNLEPLSSIKEGERENPIYKIVKLPNRKPERIDCNFNLLYTQNGEEFSIEQILAKKRDLYDKRSTSPSQKRRKVLKIVETMVLPDSQPPRNEVKQRVASPEVNSSELNNQFKNITQTSILRLNDENGANDSTLMKRPHSPTTTVTLFSKDAINEVFSMFNQNYEGNDENDDATNTENKFAIYENYTQDVSRNNIDDLTEVKPPTNKIVEKAEPAAEPVRHRTTDSILNMTPIVERTENSIHNGTPPRKPLHLNSQSSPFVSQPVVTTENASIIEHPLDPALRERLIIQISPPLKKYRTFHGYSYALSKSAQLHKIRNKISSGGNSRTPMVTFQSTGDSYSIQGILGEGGYGTVYLAESDTGALQALKVEKPANLWEYYILKQVETRLHDSDAVRSIITAHSLHYFLDESYLVLNYAQQGTILDLANKYGEEYRNGGHIEEHLCLYLTVELMKAVEAIHRIGIIHGDLKPDNCMIRFDAERALSVYDSEGDTSMDRNGIYLIDFGRSFDMTLLPPGTKFKADWHTDQQDCTEMRAGDPWSYEADYFGLAGIIHLMLFGTVIETEQLPSGKVKLRHSLKRYWQTDLWVPLFDTLLNSGNYDLPAVAKLRVLRLPIEEYLSGVKTLRELQLLVTNLGKELSI
ncbi:protein kinase BUB1 KNAG_0E03740 [Huiozyma naganishii CBS 8797]|uniref:Protein kinase domain-containing protein n=1 Tax=Huiozyma naganishii (strain ATCC MYA-139 / BCRC 22969 / CBS 8797 / KCTC 17520 / NBRC 10181 / NCYC 3082 / Yp74L-3) TaxID=1071383 RepID=J7S815_HUIN7|nr:hypothetical protein KNAG_0E03740 [Kazachstania naganishii CBS 8797]CCK70631.1 hypothetical protein KNAG_0E03740 [Kazachstania naganishii CBS 8797]